MPGRKGASSAKEKGEKDVAKEENVVYTVEFKSFGHNRLLLTQLAKLREDSRLCDVTLIVEGSRINAHRVVLAACSKYFEAMLTNGMIESCLQEIEIKDTDALALEILVNFCYTGVIKINDITVWGILPTACFLQLNEVQAFCCQFLKRRLSLSNCFTVRAFAETHTCRELFHSANEYILHNFEKIIGTEGFYHLHVDQLVEVISSEKLRVHAEEQVYAAVVEWIRFGVLDREQFFPKLLEHVRLPLCHPLFLVNTVSENASVKADAVCRDLVDEAKNYQLSKQFSSKLPNMQGPRTKPRKPFDFGGVLYIAGGNGNGKALDSVECLDLGEAVPMWRRIATMFHARDGVGVAALDNFLYVFGGRDGEARFSGAERFDPATRKWENYVSPMLHKRYAFDVATLDDFIYVVGGSNGAQCLNAVERYDPRRNQWTSEVSMGTCRAGVSVSVLNGCLYAVGGCSLSTLNTVERLDPRVGRWESLRPMSTHRSHLGCAALDGYLYAVGGRTGWDYSLSSVEQYNPLTNEWTAVAEMMVKRSGVKTVAVNGSLYAVGGFDGTSYLDTVEVLDPGTDQWSIHSNMNTERCRAGVAVI